MNYIEIILKFSMKNLSCLMNMNQLTKKKLNLKSFAKIKYFTIIQKFINNLIFTLLIIKENEIK